MGKKKLMTIINYFLRQCEEEGIAVDKIILFGSQIKKSATEESDIDVVVISNTFRRKDFWRRIEMLKNPVCKTINKFIVPLDVIAMTPEELKRKGSPLAGFARNGVVVFDAAA